MGIKEENKLARTLYHTANALENATKSARYWKARALRAEAAVEATIENPERNVKVVCPTR